MAEPSIKGAAIAALVEDVRKARDQGQTSLASSTRCPANPTRSKISAGAEPASGPA